MRSTDSAPAALSPRHRGRTRTFRHEKKYAPRAHARALDTLHMTTSPPRGWRTHTAGPFTAAAMQRWRAAAMLPPETKVRHVSEAKEAARPISSVPLLGARQDDVAECVTRRRRGAALGDHDALDQGKMRVGRVLLSAGERCGATCSQSKRFIRSHVFA